MKSAETTLFDFREKKESFVFQPIAIMTRHDEILTLLSESCGPKTQKNISMIQLTPHRMSTYSRLWSHDLLESQVLLISVSISCKHTNDFIQADVFMIKPHTCDDRDTRGCAGVGHLVH